MGTPRAITNSAGTIIKKISYDSFGNVLSDSNPAIAIPFGFAGGLHDTDTGLVRFGFRDYDPDTGRWTARDPLGFAGGDSNLYGYVFSDPVNFVDRDGLIVAQLIGAAIGIGFEVYNQVSANGWNGLGGLDYGKIGMAGLTGTVGGFAKGVLGSAVRGAVGSATNNAYQQLTGGSCGSSLDLKELGKSTLGGLGGGFLGGVGQKIGSKIGSKIYNTDNAVIMLTLGKNGLIGHVDTGKVTNSAVPLGNIGSAIGGVVGGIGAGYYD